MGSHVKEFGFTSTYVRFLHVRKKCRGRYYKLSKSEIRSCMLGSVKPERHMSNEGN